MTRQVFREATGTNATLANVAFIGGTVQPASGATQLSQVQLFNPVGSGVRIFVFRVRARSSGGTVVYGDTTPLATLTTDATNKLANATSASPTAEVRRGTDTVPRGGSKNEALVEIINTEIPIILDPGFGINIEGTTANQETGGLFEWVEGNF